MRLFKILKEVYYRMFPISDIEKAFNIKILIDNSMKDVISKADMMYNN